MGRGVQRIWSPDPAGTSICLKRPVLISVTRRSEAPKSFFIWGNGEPKDVTFYEAERGKYERGSSL